MSEAEIRTALTWVERQAKSATRGEAREVYYDAGVDAILWASKNYRPENGPFGNYCKRLVKQFTGRALAKYRQSECDRPTVAQWSEAFDPPAGSIPSAGEVPMSADLADLPPDLRDAVRFVYVDAYSLEDAGLLLGACAATVRMRLHQAARLLNPGARPRPRVRNEKRLCKGRQRGGRSTTTEDATRDESSLC